MSLTLGSPTITGTTSWALLQAAFSGANYPLALQITNLTTYEVTLPDSALSIPPSKGNNPTSRLITLQNASALQNLGLDIDFVAGINNTGTLVSVQQYAGSMPVVAPSISGASSSIAISANDPTQATSNVTALQAAISAAIGGALKIQPGKFYVNWTLVVPNKTKVSLSSATELIAVSGGPGGTNPFSFFTNAAYSNPKYVGITITSVSYGARGVRATAVFPVSMTSVLNPGDWILIDQDVSEIYLGAHEVETVSGQNVTFIMFLGGGAVGTVAANTAVTSGSTIIPVSSTSGIAIGQTILAGTFTGIPYGTTITSFIVNTSITISNAITAGMSNGQTVTYKPSLAYIPPITYTNSATQSNSGTNVLNLTSTANLIAGQPVAGNNINPCYITGVFSGYVTLSANLTGNITSGQAVTVGILTPVTASAVKCDYGIEVRGGKLNSNFENGGFVHLNTSEAGAAAGSMTGIHSIAFNNVIYPRVGRESDGPSIEMRQSIGYTVCMANAYYPEVDGIHGEGAERDGVHFYGPMWYPTIKNITGSFSDDCSIFQPTDGSVYTSVQVGTMQTIGIGGTVINQGVSGGVTLGGNFYQGGRMENILPIGDGNSGQAVIYPQSDAATGSSGFKMYGKYTLENIGGGSYPNTTGGASEGSSVSIGGGYTTSPNNYIDELELINIKGNIGILGGGSSAIISIEQLTIDGLRFDPAGENIGFYFDFCNIKNIPVKKTEYL